MGNIRSHNTLNQRHEDCVPHSYLERHLQEPTLGPATAPPGRACATVKAHVPNSHLELHKQNSYLELLGASPGRKQTSPERAPITHGPRIRSSNAGRGREGTLLRVQEVPDKTTPPQLAQECTCHQRSCTPPQEGSKPKDSYRLTHAQDEAMAIVEEATTTICFLAETSTPQVRRQ